MFRIPSFHQMPNMTFAEAEGILKLMVQSLREWNTLMNIGIVMLMVKAMICTKMMMTSLAHGVMKSMHTM